MLSISVSDILKLLDQIPIWKAVSNLPKRVAELERRLAVLEAQKANVPRKSAPDPRECPVCGSEMKVTKEAPDPLFGDFGVKVHHLDCPDCGNKVTRQYDPQKGYG